MANRTDAEPVDSIRTMPIGGWSAGPRAWWETRWMAALAILAAMVPLAYPAIPPLVDLIGHLGRYRVELGDSLPLERYYDFHWALIGNLGVDVLVMGLAPLVGLEPAVKLIALAIPALTVAGFLWVAREVHGRIPPTAYLAIPFAYGQPFLFGFVNFALAMALAFLAFGLWLRLSRLGHIRLRQWLFVPISLIVYFTHAYGWGALGLLCFSAEAVRLHDRGERWFTAAFHAALNASVMALPVIITLLWREGAGGHTSDWFNWKVKWVWLKGTLRDRWRWFDQASLIVVGAIFFEAMRNPRTTYSRNLAFSGLVLLVGFVLLPRIVFGSAYADMRLLPFVFAVFLLAIRFKRPVPRPLGQGIALMALLFVAVRLGGNSYSLAIAARDQQAKLGALAHIPTGARVVSFYGLSCSGTWALARNSHLGAMVIARREGFSNDQWYMDGLNLLEIKYRAAGAFTFDPSEVVRPNRCPDPLHRSIDDALGRLPRRAFDYLWLIDAPAHNPRLTSGMDRVWAGAASELYRINLPGAVPPQAIPQTAAAPARPARAQAGKSLAARR
ncbi:MAG: hypothetical protein ABIR63_05490 [Sphingomicrobium sp.]